MDTNIRIGAVFFQLRLYLVMKSKYKPCFIRITWLFYFLFIFYLFFFENVVVILKKIYIFVYN